MSVDSRPVATFSIYYQQYLAPNGELTQPLPAFAADSARLVKLYKAMLFARLFNAKAIALQRTGRLGTFPSIEGEEAVSVGIGDAMAADDVFLPYYREYGAQLMRGVTPEEILLYWGGDERGNDFKNSHDFPFCVPIGSQLPHAAGAAAAMKFRKLPHCVVVGIGDGGTSEGDFYEAINLAGVWKLPLVVVVSNNCWAISVPIEKQTAAQTLAQKAIAAGFEGLQVDGNDVIAVADAVRTALAKARRGEGPTLIEALTYRMGDHTTADDAKRYRDMSLVECHKHEDPIARLRAYLFKEKYWDDARDEQFKAESLQKVAVAVDNYLNTKPQSVNTMFDYLYESLPSALQEQYLQLIHYAKE